MVEGSIKGNGEPDPKGPALVVLQNDIRLR